MVDACRFALRLERDEFVLDAEAVFPGSGMTGLFGRSGSGKTTLLRCLAGLESDARGRIEICGRRWLDSRAGVALPVEVRRVGYVFQEARLFPHLDVAGNLAYARRRSSKSLLPGATHIESLFGVAGLGARRIDELSGGEARRVAIVRALSQGPELLLLDEPLTGLDTTARVQLLDALAAIDNACDAPSLFVSHDLDEILRLCDHAIVITDGRVLRAGPLDELLGDPQVVGQERYGALLEAHVFGYDTVTGLTTIESGGLRLRVPGRVEGSTVRVRVLARDVSVCLHEPTQTSVLNVVPAQVASLDEEGDHARIALDCGDRRLLALLSRHSVRQLGLVPGAAVYAQVKGAAVRPAAQSKRMVSDPGKVSA